MIQEDRMQPKALMAVAEEFNIEFLDMKSPWQVYLGASKKPWRWFHRDRVHANDRGRQITGRILERYFNQVNYFSLHASFIKCFIIFVLMMVFCNGTATAKMATTAIVSKQKKIGEINVKLNDVELEPGDDTRAFFNNCFDFMLSDDPRRRAWTIPPQAVRSGLNQGKVTVKKGPSFRLEWLDLALNEECTNHPGTVNLDNLLGVVRGSKDIDSPGITELPDGRLLVCYRDKANKKNFKTYIAESTDGGKNWTTIYDFRGDFYGPSFFHHDNAIYLFLRGKTTGQYNDLLLFKSSDHGRNWESTILIKATKQTTRITTGNTPVLLHDGKFVVAVSDWGGKGKWVFPQQGRIFCGWCDVDKDPMIAKNWNWAKPLEMPDPNKAPFDKGGWLEPNAVIAPNGDLLLVTRVDSDEGELGAIARVNMKTKTIEFEDRFPAKPGQTGFLRIPGGGCGMFFIQYDPVSKRYLMLSNPRLGGSVLLWGIKRIRNCMALFESKDLYHWSWVKSLIKDNYYEDWQESAAKTGFQQPSFVISGDDIIAVSRTAYGKTKNWHDANMITVHKMADFRSFLEFDGIVAHYAFDDPQDLGKDSSRQGGNDAIVTGAVTSAKGIHGSCAEFKKDGYLSLGHRVASELHGASKITISFLMNTRETTGTILDIPIDNTKNGIGISLIEPGVIAVGGRSRSQDQFQRILFQVGSLVDTWHKVVVTIDYVTNQISLCLDGKPIEGRGKVDFSGKTFERALPSVYEVIGKSNNTTRFFIGMLDDIQISCVKIVKPENTK